MPCGAISCRATRHFCAGKPCRDYNDASIEMQHMPAAITTITKELLFNILPFSLIKSGLLDIFAYRQYRSNPYASNESLPERRSLLSPFKKNVKDNFYPLCKRFRAAREIHGKPVLKTTSFCGFKRRGPVMTTIRYAQL